MDVAEWNLNVQQVQYCQTDTSLVQQADHLLQRMHLHSTCSMHGSILLSGVAMHQMSAGLYENRKLFEHQAQHERHCACTVVATDTS